MGKRVNKTLAMSSQNGVFVMVRGTISGRSASFLVFLITICLSVNVVAEQSNSTHQKEKPQWGKVNEGLTMSVVPEKKKIKGGRPVVVTVHIKNVSDERKTVFTYRSTKLERRQYKFIVKDSDGDDVNLLQYGKKIWGVFEYEKLPDRLDRDFLTGRDTPMPEKLAPGKQLEHRIIVNRRRDMSLQGSYRIQARRYFLVPSKEKHNIQLRSNVVEVEVIAE